MDILRHQKSFQSLYYSIIYGITFDVWLAVEVTGKERTRSGLKTTALNRNERLKMF